MCLYLIIFLTIVVRNWYAHYTSKFTKHQHIITYNIAFDAILTKLNNVQNYSPGDTTVMIHN